MRKFQDAKRTARLSLSYEAKSSLHPTSGHKEELCRLLTEEDKLLKPPLTGLPFT